MKYTLVLKLHGAPAGAVAVEWTDVAAPRGSGDGWEPCLRRADGSWCFASHDRAQARHRRDPGPFDNVAIRYRLTPDGPWSPASAARKEITIVAVTAEDGTPPPARAQDWSALEPFHLGGNLTTAAFVLAGPAGGAVAVEWTGAATPGEADWASCRALGEGRWHLGAAAAETAIADIAIRYRLAPDGPLSAASEDRKDLDAGGGGPLPVIPSLIIAPALAGAGRIGEEVTAGSGVWAGDPAPALSLQWCRDGAAIEGAAGSRYTPGPEDDLTALTCRVTASNGAGSVEAETAALTITYAPPSARGLLPEEIFDEGTGAQEIDAAADFVGENLAFAVTGANAVIDAASGLVRIPTDVPVSGETVTVTASNSGGSAESAFQVTVEAAEPEEIPPAPVLTAAQVGSEWIDEAAGTWRACFDFSGYAAGAVEAGRWTGLSPANAGFGSPETFEPLERDESDGLWKAASADPATGRHVRTDPPADLRVQLRTDGVWSEISENAAPLLQAPASGGGGNPPPPASGRVRQLTSRTAYDVAQNVLGGWGEQTCIGGSQVGDRITVPGDMNGVNASRDGGKTWHPRPMRGYHANGGLSCCHHPENPERIFLVANNAVMKDDGDLMKCGLYTSHDDGVTWENSIPLQNTRGWNYMFYVKQVQMNFQWIDFARSNPDIGYCLIQQRAANYADLNSRVDYLQAGLYRTDDGGRSWRPLVAFPGLNAGNRNGHRFGHIYILRVDPRDPERIYLGCESGLYSARGTIRGDGDFTLIRGGWNNRGSSVGSTSSGMLANPGCRSIVFHADGTVYYTIDHDGLYRGTNNNLEGATRRYNAYAQPNNDGRIYQIAVSPVRSNNLWFFRGTRAERDFRNFAPLFSTNGGSSWQVCRDDLEGPGDPIPLHQKLNGENVTPYPSPTDATTCIVDRGNRVRTTDGIQFLKYQDGWTGAGSNAVHVDPARPGIVVVGVTDRGSWRTEDFGRTWDEANVENGGSYVGPTNRPGQSVLSLPGNRGWLVGYASGSLGSQQKVRFYYEGGRIRSAFPDGTNQHPCFRMCLDADGRTVYAGTRRSANYGIDGWQNVATPAGGNSWFGIGTAHPAASGVVWGMRRDSGNADSHEWYRSSDGGGSWTRIADETDTSIDTGPFTGGATSMAAHPGNPDRCFVHSKAEVFEIGPGGFRRALGFKAFSRGVQGARPLLISAIAVDHNDPRIVYVGIGELGGHCPLYRTTDGGATWEDASGQMAPGGGVAASGFIPCFENRDLAISPTCGTLVWIGRGTGWYVVAPPTDRVEGYRASGGVAPGELFNRVVTAADFD